MSKLQSNVKNSVIGYMESKDYTYLRHLGEGSFGYVIAALSPKVKKVAVKVIKEKNVWHFEEKIWPLLKHPNILPLKKTVKLQEIGVSLYFTPLMSKSLYQVLSEVEFHQDPNGLKRLKKWFTDILKGLSYLHRKGYCHLDIKDDNILISGTDSAVLSDFSGIHVAKMPVERVCSPLQFRPPEWWFKHDTKVTVNGVHFDVWTYGFMALNILTGNWLCYTLRAELGQKWSWEKDVREIIARAMQETYFDQLLRKALPNVVLSSYNVKAAFSFVHTLLRINPNERPSAKVAASHPFLNNGKKLPTPSHDWVIQVASQPGNSVSFQPVITQGDKFSIRTLSKEPFVRIKRSCMNPSERPSVKLAPTHHFLNNEQKLLAPSHDWVIQVANQPANSVSFQPVITQDDTFSIRTLSKEPFVRIKPSCMKTQKYISKVTLDTTLITLKKSVSQQASSNNFKSNKKYKKGIKGWFRTVCLQLILCGKAEE